MEGNLFNLISPNLRNDKIRLHLPAIPHTITHIEYSHCAFTGKVLRFSPMMKSRGYEVFHYGVEGSESEADKDIIIMNKEEWKHLKLESFKKKYPNLSNDEYMKMLEDKSIMSGDLAHISNPLYIEFNKRLKKALKENYRSNSTDIVCLPFGFGHKQAIDGENFVHIESGIGYPDSFANYRIFESYAWMHQILGKENKMWGQNYWFVIPNYFNVLEWPLNLNPIKNRVGFLGRIYDGKGCHVIVEIAKRFPTIEFVLCGQGDPKPFLTEPNIIYKPPIHGLERGEYLGSLCALIAPTGFVEPFCGVSVEAQLCGTPVISVDYGAPTETIEQFKTGMLCHSLSDLCVGVEAALNDLFDRQYIHNRAVALYEMYNLAKKYDYTFKSILEIHNGNNGWYSPISHLGCLA